MSTHLTVLLTGANSGLGFAILQRLPIEFLQSNPESHTLTVIFTTRSTSKAEDTLRRVSSYLSSNHPGWASRVTLVPESVDLTKLSSVKALATRLCTSEKITHIDAVLLNAGISGYAALDWPRLFYGILTRGYHAILEPDCGVQLPQQFTDPQTSNPADVLGLTFCANVFGHYMLVRWLLPILTRTGGYLDRRSRVVWVSSMEAYQERMTLSDIQGVHGERAYETSKCLMDIMCVSAASYSSIGRKYAAGYLGGDTGVPEEKRPRLLLTHPGVCATSMVQFLPGFVQTIMLYCFILARMLGSKWHTSRPYSGATAMVKCVLAEDKEVEEGVKYGSAASRMGQEWVEVERVDVKEGEAAVEAVWGGLEGLRREWEGKI